MGEKDPIEQESGTNIVVERMPAIGKWQKTAAMAQMSTPLDPPVWANGKCGAGLCPTHVLSYASDGAAHGGLGMFHLWAMSGVNNPLDGTAGGTLRITSHEFWHNLEAAWGRGAKGVIDGQGGRSPSSNRPLPPWSPTSVSSTIRAACRRISACRRGASATTSTTPSGRTGSTRRT